jgi:hypothetical protein
MCLARQKEGRISLLFTQNDATSKKKAETRPISKAAKHILSIYFNTCVIYGLYFVKIFDDI